MKITQQVQEIMRHPFFLEAIYSFNMGIALDMEKLLFETMFHVYDKVAFNASNLYGENKWQNSTVIKPTIRNMPPPENLDVRLPIPKERHAPNTKVFQAKKTTHKKPHTQNVQLTLFMIEVA